jgi:MYXO-CTERM domain-containing protein
MDDKPAADGPTVPPVPPKQGGCGCRVAGESRGGAMNGIAALGLATVVVARRQRRGQNKN